MNVFLTGVTGNIGSAVARRLLSIEGGHIWLLMRSAGDGDLPDRLARLFELWQLTPAQQREAALRLMPLRGDMALPRFGLADNDWSAVAAQCDTLIHAAGVVRMNLPLEEARRFAVGSADNLMSLADHIAKHRNVHIAYISTVGVIGRLSQPLVDDWVIQARGFHNTYEQSKAEAEDRLRQWSRRDNATLTVHRPSMVVGASDGTLLRHQVFYYLCEFLSGRHTKGIQPKLGDMSLDTIPVDYVADAVVWAVQNQRDDRIFNLCSGVGHEVKLSDVQRWVRSTMGDRGIHLPPVHALPPSLFTAATRLLMLLAPKDAKKRLATLPVLLDYLHAPQVFDGKNTRDYLGSKARLTLPTPETYLPAIIERYFT